VIEPRPGDRPDTPGAVIEPRPGNPPDAPAAVFSLENRPVPGLYFVAWLLTLGGLALVLIGILAQNRATSPPLVLGGLVAVTIGLASAAAYQIAARRLRPAGRYRGPAPLIVFGVVVAAAQVVIGPFVLLGVIGEDTNGVFVAALAIAAGYIATIALFVVRSGALSWRDMGWPDRSVLSVGRLIDDAIVAVAIMPAAILGAGVIGNIVAAAAGVQLQSPLPDPRTASDQVVLVLTAVVLAPIGEELFFRGFSLTAWQIDLGARTALIRSSVFFAAAHLINLTSTGAAEGVALAAVTFFVYLPLGFLLGWLFQRRGIIAAILGHAAANGTVVLLNALFRPAGTGQ
jgi:membrane protease YdiL (CAAX protease family)